jgi:hypothetical protein
MDVPAHHPQQGAVVHWQPPLAGVLGWPLDGPKDPAKMMQI